MRRAVSDLVFKTLVIITSSFQYAVWSEYMHWIKFTGMLLYTSYPVIFLPELTALHDMTVEQKAQRKSCMRISTKTISSWDCCHYNLTAFTTKEKKKKKTEKYIYKKIIKPPQQNQTHKPMTWIIFTLYLLSTLQIQNKKEWKNELILCNIENEKLQSLFSINRNELFYFIFT